jgi:RNA polymerase sigma-70 factor (ECF subfamily)
MEGNYSVINNIISIQDVEDVSYITEEQLYREYCSTVYKFCMRLVFQKEDADDLFQDTYVRAFSEIEKIRVSENPQSFLLSIAISLWKSQKRKFARRNRIAPMVSFDEAYVGKTASLEDDVIENEESIIVREMVNDLPDKLKIPIVMYYTVGMSISDIAGTLKLPKGTVTSHLTRAREVIRKGMVQKYESK